MLKLEELIKDKIKKEEMKREAKKIKQLTKFDLVKQAWESGITSVDGIYTVLLEAEKNGLLVRRPRSSSQRDNHTRLRDQARWYLSQLAKRGEIDRVADMKCRPYDGCIDSADYSMEVEAQIHDSLNDELDTLDDMLITND